MKRLSSLLFLTLLLPACGGLNYSQTYPGAEVFHADSIAVLPVKVGNYEMARAIVGNGLVKKLRRTEKFKLVLAPQSVKAGFGKYPEMVKKLSDYIVRLNTLGVSDKNLAKDIGDVYQVQALMLTNVTHWGYGRVAGDKVAQVGLKLTLVDAKSGDIVWNASHNLMEDYLVFRPPLEDACAQLLEMLLDEMPYNELVAEQSSVQKQ